jgi:hypothetical protein
MGLWFREWLKVGTAVALLGGLLWLVLERDVGLPALLKSAAWGLVVWVGGGLIWIGLQYGHRREAAREWSRINRVTSSGFSPVNRAPRTGSAGSTAAAHSTVEVFTVDGATAAGMAAETPILTEIACFTWSPAAVVSGVYGNVAIIWLCRRIRSEVRLVERYPVEFVSSWANTTRR